MIEMALKTTFAGCSWYRVGWVIRSTFVIMIVVFFLGSYILDKSNDLSEKGDQ
jgi:hypothetical protein